jgi:hypothetical protein
MLGADTSAVDGHDSGVRLCDGCGEPLVGMRRNAKHHNESCRSRARQRYAESPLGRFSRSVGLIPRNGPMVLAIHARTRRNPVREDAE